MHPLVLSIFCIFFYKTSVQWIKKSGLTNEHTCHSTQSRAPHVRYSQTFPTITDVPFGDMAIASSAGCTAIEYLCAMD